MAQREGLVTNPKRTRRVWRDERLQRPPQRRVGAGNSAVVVDLPRWGPMLSPRVPNLVPIPGPRMERETPGQRPRPNYGHPHASTLLVAAGDNPERMRSEASFAALCGTSPIEASSGRTVRHRLNRSGNRLANNALWRIAMVRLRCDERSIDYARRRRAEGKTRREIVRCLKRHIAREIYRLLTDPPPVPKGADLRRQRTQQGLTIHQTAQALGAAPTQVSELERGISHNRELAERYQRHLAANTT